MPYSNITTMQIFDDLHYKLSNWSPAERWVKAENIMEIRAIIIKWAKRIRDGTVEHYLPGMGCDVSATTATKMMADLEDEMEHEVRTRMGLGCDDGPGFDMLSVPVQRNMTDELLAAHKPYAFIKAEVAKRLEQGEVIPPKGTTLWSELSLSEPDPRDFLLEEDIREPNQGFC